MNQPAVNEIVPTYCEGGDSRDLRRVLGQFATGITVVTIQGPDGPFGMTVNSFSSVSLEPALVLWSVDKASKRCELFENAQHFAVNVLMEHQSDIALSLAKSPTDFSTRGWFAGKNGAPVLAGALASFECRQETLYAGGDHALIVGRVLQASARDGAPLVFFDGDFGSVTTLPQCPEILPVPNVTTV